MTTWNAGRTIEIRWALARVLTLGVLMAAGEAVAADQYWNPTTTAKGAGSNVWDTSVGAWANGNAGTNAPVVWGSGNNANFTLNSGVNTVVVNGVAASLVNLTAGTHVFQSGTGPLVLAGPLTNTGVAVTFNAGIALAANQSWYLTQNATVFGAITGAFALTKSGTGALTLSNANTFSSGLSVPLGTVNGYGQAAGNPFGTGMLALGGTNSANANGAAAITLIGLATPTTAANGDLIANGSFNSGTLTVNATAGAGPTTLQCANLTRNGRATLLVTPTQSSLGAKERLTFTGSGVTPINGILAPWLVIAQNSGDFATYNGGFVSNAVYGTVLNSSLTTQVVSLAVATNLAAPQTVYALKAGANINLNGNGLTIGDGMLGGLILNNGVAVTNSGNAASLDFGSAEGLVYVDSGKSGAIYVPVAGTGGLTKFGAGTLTLAATSMAYSGNTFIQAGTLTLNPSLDSTYGNNFNTSGAGSFTKSGTKNLTLTGANVIALAANGITGGGTLTIGAGSVTTNLGSGTLFATTGANMLAVTNGGRLFMPIASTINTSPSSNTVIVAGNGSVLDMVIAPQMTLNTRAQMIVTDGGVITNVGLLRCSDGNISNNITISNGGQVFATSADLKGGTLSTVWIGGTNAAGTPSRLTLTGGGYAQNTYTCTSNSLIVAADGILTAAGGVALGYSWSTTGDCNRLIVTNGGRASITAGTSTLGYCPNNAIWVGGTNPAGSASVINWNNNRCEVGYNSWTNDRATVDAGGIMTNAAFSVGDDISGVNYPFNAWLIVTNGGRLYGSVAVGTKSHQNTFVITGSNSLFSAGGTSLSIGAASNNAMFVDGGFLANLNSFSIGYVQQAIAYGVGNSATLTNGGQLYCTGTVYVGDTESYGNLLVSSNRLLVAGSGSLMSLGGAALNIGTLNFAGDAGVGNFVQITAGGVLTNAGTVTVGGTSASSTNQANRLVISAGGALFASTLNVGSGAGITTGNVVTVSDGAMLEANTLACYNTVNTISNSAGIYQFTTATPTITLNTNVIAINNGTLSFRNVTNASVSANVFGTLLTNLTWSGTNGFRLTAATNGMTTSQTYVFEPGIAATNYARLEMVGGSTCYRGQSSNSLTIGQNPGSSASMLCSNTAAVVAIPFTNNGTLRIVNSTLTLTTNAVLNGTVVVDLNRLANTGTVLNAQKDLTLGGTLQFIGAPTTNLTLMTFSGARSGKFLVTGLPANYTVSYSATQNGAVSLKQTPPGTVLLFL